jgi:heavy metal efflux system protein
VISLVVPLALLLSFVLLFATFGNVKDGLLVFIGIPFALTGGLLALWLRGIPLSIPAAVGFIALSGVAVLNGPVMLSFIRQLREDGKARRCSRLLVLPILYRWAHRRDEDEQEEASPLRVRP